MKSIPVSDISFSKVPGYVTINQEFNIPLQRLEPAEGKEMYYFEKDAAITKAITLNKTEFDLVKAEKAKIDATHAFLLDIVENQRY